jgi:hypothetical protein
MSVSPAAVQRMTGSGVVIGDSDLLPRHAVFRTRDLDEARGHLCGVFAEHGVNYLPRERHLEFRHRQAKLVRFHRTKFVGVGRRRNGLSPSTPRFLSSAIHAHRRMRTMAASSPQCPPSPIGYDR